MGVKNTVEIAQLWQHNRGNYTTPTIYQKKLAFLEILNREEGEKVQGVLYPVLLGPQNITQGGVVRLEGVFFRYSVT